MSTLIKENGVWKEPGMIYVKDQGVWKEAGGGGLGLPLLGEPYGGGYFVGLEYTPSGALLYIAAAKESEIELQWKDRTTSTPGAESATDGMANTLAMVNDSFSHPAAEYCHEYRGGGFSDWFLLSSYQLSHVHGLIGPNGGTTPLRFRADGDQAMNSTWYWSSTQAGSGNAVMQSFSSGVVSNGSKTTVRWTRPFRLELVEIVT